jgi:hypoxanthine phosphoribosyltransferase
MSARSLEQPLYSQLWRTEDEVQARINEMAIEITDHFDGEDPLFVKLLMGGDPFATDLMKSIARQRPRFHHHLDAMIVSRYGAGRAGGELRIVTDLSPKAMAKDRHVVLLDDITDTNETVRKTSQHLKVMHGVASVSVAVLVDRITPAQPEPGADFVGFTFEGGEWLTGMGLDDHNLAREGNRWAGFIAIANSVEPDS